VLNRFAFLLVLAVGFLWITPARADLSVHDVRLGLQEGGGTRFVMELDGKADYRLFLLDNPQRAVIDLPNLIWPEKLAEKLTADGRGLVKSWRHGQFGEGTRVVLDLIQPVKVKAAQLIPAQVAGGTRLVLDLAPSDNINLKESFGARAKAQLPAPASANTNISINNLIDRSGGQAAKATRVSIINGIPVPPALPERKRTVVEYLPLIVIDPGHGGVDPGALAVGGGYEKNLTLAVARQLAQRLRDSGQYRVRLTRDKDVFVRLRDRVKIARNAKADLFISLHADSIQKKDTRGLSIYTLSNKASDREAAQLAESENRADMMAGLDVAGDNDDIAAIFISMNQRASMNGSRRFSGLLVDNLANNVKLLDGPQRSAGFAVLTAPDIPSVLIEMGYLSSQTESKLLQQPEHRSKIVDGVEAAINSFFIDQVASNR